MPVELYSASYIDELGMLKTEMMLVGVGEVPMEVFAERHPELVPSQLHIERVNFVDGCRVGIEHG